MQRHWVQHAEEPESEEGPGAATLQHNNNTQGHQQQLLLRQDLPNLTLQFSITFKLDLNNASKKQLWMEIWSFLATAVNSG